MAIAATTEMTSGHRAESRMHNTCAIRCHEKCSVDMLHTYRPSNMHVNKYVRIQCTSNCQFNCRNVLLHVSINQGS